MEFDTNNDIFPEGTYRFRVAEVPTFGATQSGYEFLAVVFYVEGVDMPYRERFMRWTSGPLCRALGLKEVRPGKFTFELPDFMGRECVATIKHETIEKGASAGQVVARMKDIKPLEGLPKKTRAAVEAQAPVGAADADDIPF